MKKILLISAMLLFALSASAQYKDFTIDNPSQFKLVQIDEYDGVTAFFFTVTAEEATGFSVSDQTCIYVDGESKRCKLTKAANIPYSSENTYVDLKAGESANFVLEFEAVPLDKTFSIVENKSKRNKSMFNISNIKVNTEVKSEKMDLLNFLNYYDCKYTGTYTKEGKNWRFYDYNGLTVASSMVLENLDLVRIAQIHLTIDNASGHDVSYSARNITVEARKNDNQPWTNLPVLTMQEYDNYVQRDNNDQTASYAYWMNPAANAVGDMRRYEVKKDDVGTKVGLTVLEALLRVNDAEKISEFREDLNENRERLWNNYMEDSKVPNESSYGGFVAFKNKGYRHYRVTVEMNGFDYVFLVDKK